MESQRGKCSATPLASHNTSNGSWWRLEMLKWPEEKKHPATEGEGEPQFITAVSSIAKHE